MVDTKFKKGLVPWMKGKHHTEETKRKISEVTKKAMSKPEVMKKVSKTFFKKGQTSWNKGLKGVTVSGMKGKHHSSETRKKLSESHKGQISWNKGKKTGKPAWNKGIPNSEEAKRKISEALNGKKKPLRSEEHKRKLSESRKGNKARLGKKTSEETKRRIGLAHLGKHHSEETKRKLSLAQIGKKFPEITERTKEQILFSERSRKQILKRLEAGNLPQLNTKPERQIKEELLKRGYKEGIDFIHQYRFMNKFMCDFCFLKQKVIVEAYGDYWHCNPKIYPVPISSHQIKDMRKDKSREAYITAVDNRSWTYLVLWEMDIKENVVKCVDRIEEVLNLKNKPN